MTKSKSDRMRLPLDPDGDIAGVQNIRKNAVALRSRVSKGYYGEKELEQFWNLTRIAASALMTTNAELSERAGVGESFFASVARDRRRPKLPNFLSSLSAIIESADEILFDAVSKGKIRPPRAPQGEPGTTLSIERDYRELAALTNSLAQLAFSEIYKLDLDHPNHPDAIESNRRQRELLQIFGWVYKNSRNLGYTFEAANTSGANRKSG